VGVAKWDTGVQRHQFFRRNLKSGSLRTLNWKIISNFFVCVCVVLGLELRAFTSSQSTNPFL
jgi:hypothetical protein